MLMITKGMILACMMKGNLDSIEIDQQEIEYFIDALRQNLEGTPIKNILPCIPTTADVKRIEELPEEEKVYDRNSSVETLKLIMKLGFKISKDEE